MDIAFFAEQQLNTGTIWKSADIHYGDLLSGGKSDTFCDESNDFFLRLLSLRGINDDDIHSFLNPSINDLNDPFLFKNMKKAIDRIQMALCNHENILIFGDYDVDGMTSTAILYSYLKRNGANVEYHIPSRDGEGYGLSLTGLKLANYEKFSLIITVDCGITSVKEISWLKSKSIDVIVTDHHTYVSEIPDVYTIVSVSEPGETYPFKSLAGVGVALKVIQALSMALGDNEGFFDYIEFAALGTVADMVPLVSENRAIVSLGIDKMYDSKFVGIKTLLNHMFLNNGTSKIDADSLGFFCCPRFNAAGRVGDVNVAMQLLLSEDSNEAEQLVAKLEQYNDLRKECEKEVLISAEKYLKNKYKSNDASFLVLVGEGWNEGVIGIVASRLCEKYNCPTILISLKDGIGKGSCRSIESVNLFRCLEACSEFLEGFGGHRLAAGLNIKEENIDLFERKLNEVVREQVSDEQYVKVINADIAVDHNDMNISNTLEIEKLSPFGEMNRRPIAYANFLEIKDCRYIGQNNRHLKLTLSKGGNDFTALLFNKGEFANRIFGCKYINALFNFNINYWRGSETFQMKLEDFKTLQWTRSMWAFYREFDCIRKKYNFGENAVPLDNGSKTCVINDFSSWEDLVKRINYFVDSSIDVNVVVNDLLSMDYVLKAVLKDIKYRCPVRLHYGEDVIEDSVLDIAPADAESNMPNINIFANVLPEKCLSFNGVNIVYGKWYDEKYLSDVIESLGANTEQIGVSIVNSNVLLPSNNEKSSIVQMVRTYMNKLNEPISFSKLEGYISRACGRKINPYKMYLILKYAEDSGEIFLNIV